MNGLHNCQNRIKPTTEPSSIFQDKNKLDDFKYPRTALYLPAKYRKEAMCEAQDGIFGGHNAAHKTYLKISRVWVKLLEFRSLFYSYKTEMETS
jgi:hypothetical protein